MTLNLSPARFNHPDHPLRPPAWRWLRAADLWDQGGQPSAPSDDVWVRKALRLRRALQQDKAWQQRLEQLSHLHQAYQLYSEAPALRRWEVEARLLTDEPFGRIAAKCRTTPRVIHAYEQVFFNVRDRLKATGYISNVVLGGDLLTRLREKDLGAILKLYAFGGGVHVLEAVLDYFRHPPVVPARPELLPAANLAKLREKLLVQLSVVTRCLVPNGKALRKRGLLDEVRAVIDPDGREAAFPSLRSPPLPTLMSCFGDAVCSPTSSGKPVSAPVPMEPDPGRPEPPCPNAQPFSHSVNGPTRRKGAQKVAVA